VLFSYRSFARVSFVGNRSDPGSQCSLVRLRHRSDPGSPCSPVRCETARTLYSTATALLLCSTATALLLCSTATALLLCVIVAVLVLKGPIARCRSWWWRDSLGPSRLVHGGGVGVRSDPTRSWRRRSLGPSNRACLPPRSLCSLVLGFARTFVLNELVLFTYRSRACFARSSVGGSARTQARCAREYRRPSRRVSPPRLFHSLAEAGPLVPRSLCSLVRCRLCSDPRSNRASSYRLASFRWVVLFFL
jgi:hypothetical protein